MCLSTETRSVQKASPPTLLPWDYVHCTCYLWRNQYSSETRPWNLTLSTRVPSSAVFPSEFGCFVLFCFVLFCFVFHKLHVMIRYSGPTLVRCLPMRNSEPLLLFTRTWVRFPAPLAGVTQSAVTLTPAHPTPTSDLGVLCDQYPNTWRTCHTGKKAYVNKMKDPTTKQTM